MQRLLEQLGTLTLVDMWHSSRASAMSVDMGECDCPAFNLDYSFVVDDRHEVPALPDTVCTCCTSGTCRSFLDCQLTGTLPPELGASTNIIELCVGLDREPSLDINWGCCIVYCDLEQGMWAFVCVDVYSSLILTYNTIFSVKEAHDVIDSNPMPSHVGIPFSSTDGWIFFAVQRKHLNIRCWTLPIISMQAHPSTPPLLVDYACAQSLLVTRRDFHGNQLTGTVPSEFGMLTGLTLLCVHSEWALCSSLGDG